ncbi:MAG: hypothetical protein M3300_14580, partial [Actinomycetota bacterium]|nr:hypothetical protein [Actinomycetota bacterium]
GFSDGVQTYPVAERIDGVYIQVPELTPPPRTVADAMVETLVAWGVRTVFGMVGHFTWDSPTRCAAPKNAAR